MKTLGSVRTLQSNRRVLIRPHGSELQSVFCVFNVRSLNEFISLKMKIFTEPVKKINWLNVFIFIEFNLKKFLFMFNDDIITVNE